MTGEASHHDCLSTRHLLDLAEGGLSSSQAKELLLDIEHCSECMLLLGEAGLAIALDAEDADDAEPCGYVATGSLLGATVARRYRVERWLGRGGMGEVYEARDLELGERVALKTIIPRLARHGSALSRFKREVRLARQIVHPNVCRVLEFGKEGEGEGAMYFLTMELLEGETLSEKLRRDGALSPDDVAQIGAQLCAGLAAIHQAGVLHRDVKPSNIMLLPSNRQNAAGVGFVATLLDFGIARAFARGAARESGYDRAESPADPQRPSASTWTSQTAVGTPDYMAPEQISGGRLSAATDLYSLGVVLCEMITGKRPRRLDPSGQLIEPQDSLLGGIVNSCLDIDPSRRPRSATELKEALVRFSFRETNDLRDRGSPSPGDSRPPLVRNRRHLFAAVGGLLAMGTAALLWWAQPIQPTFPSKGRDLAIEPVIVRPGTSTPTVRGDGVAAEPRTEGEMPDHEAVPTGAGQVAPKEDATAVESVTRGVVEPAGEIGSNSGSKLAKNCSPPYFYDDDGIKIFRKECL